jgi:hypothetical protein
MIIGKWSTRALGELRPYDNDVLVFLADGTGWLYQFNRDSWVCDTFAWGWNENGSIHMSGVAHEGSHEGEANSRIHHEAIFFTISEKTPEERTITFSVPLGSGHQLFGFETDEVPDYRRQSSEEERIREWIQSLHWYTPSHLIQSASDELVNIPGEYVHLLMQPSGKACWENAALVLARMDVGQLQECVPQLLEWLQDLNWPGAGVIAGILVNMGEMVVPHLKPILLGTDETWTYWLLTQVVQNWPTELVAELKAELAELSQRHSEEEIDSVAREILLEHRLG